MTPSPCHQMCTFLHAANPLGWIFPPYLCQVLPAITKAWSRCGSRRAWNALRNSNKRPSVGRRKSKQSRRRGCLACKQSWSGCVLIFNTRGIDANVHRISSTIDDGFTTYGGCTNVPNISRLHSSRSCFHGSRCYHILSCTRFTQFFPCQEDQVQSLSLTHTLHLFVFG